MGTTSGGQGDDRELGRELLVDRARRHAQDLLADLPDRWRHSRAVAARAAQIAPVVAPGDAPVLVAAAWLHDIGYVPALRRTGFHPLDGATHLREEGWPRLVVGLVAQHSGARHVAAVHGLTEQMLAFDHGEFSSGPLADALTYADQTTGPDGRPQHLEDRLAEMLRRHGPDSPNARCHHLRAPDLRGAVSRTEQRLDRASRGTPTDLDLEPRHRGHRSGPGG